jgi:hypothetical protein
VAVNGNAGVLPVSRFLGEPADGDIKMQNANHLVTLEHRLDDNWHLRTGIFHKDGTLDGYSTEGLSCGPTTLPCAASAATAITAGTIPRCRPNWAASCRPAA